MLKILKSSLAPRPNANTRRPTQTAPEQQTDAPRGRANACQTKRRRRMPGPRSATAVCNCEGRLVCRRRGGGGQWRVWTGAGCGRGSEARTLAECRPYVTEGNKSRFVLSPQRNRKIPLIFMVPKPGTSSVNELSDSSDCYCVHNGRWNDS